MKRGQNPGFYLGCGGLGSRGTSEKPQSTVPMGPPNQLGEATDLCSTPLAPCTCMVSSLSSEEGHVRLGVGVGSLWLAKVTQLSKTWP